ncbi:MAG: hypothetical protein WCX95_01165 [Candidatus Gracilibacteria bacterium]
MPNLNIKKIILVTFLLLTFICPLEPTMAETVKVDTLISKPDTIENTGDTSPTANLSRLPKVSLEQSVGIAIKTVLRWSFYLTLISLVVAAIYYIMSMGKEEDLTKARNITLYLVIGMAIIAGAYGIVTGISRFNFFSAEIPTDQIQEAEAAK